MKATSLRVVLALLAGLAAAPPLAGQEAPVDHARSVEQIKREIEGLTDAGALATAYNRLALEFAELKDFRNARASGQEAVKRSPRDPVLLGNLGMYQLLAGDHGDAVQSLTQARDLATDPKDRYKRSLNLAHAYIMQGQSSDQHAFESAIRELEAHLLDHSDDPDLMKKLSEAYHFKGEGDRAVDFLEHARRLRPFTEVEEHRYQQLKGAQQLKADKQFVKNGSNHFEIEFGDKSQASRVQLFLDLLEQAYDEVGARFDVRPSHKVFVSVYSGEEFTAAMKVPWAAGMQSGNRIDLRVHPRAADQDYKNTIYHEYTHHVVHIKANQMAVPAWFNEGIAMHAEVTLDLRPYLRTLERAMRDPKPAARYLPFDSIAKSFHELKSEAQIEQAYAQGYTAVARVIQLFGAAAIPRILVLLGSRQEFGIAFEQVTGTPWRTFEREWYEERLRAEPVGPPAAASPVAAPVEPSAAPEAPPAIVPQTTDPTWLGEVGRALDAGQGAGALAILSGLPGPDRQSLDGHWALARVHQALGQPARAGEALATAALVVRTGAAQRGRDFSGTKRWLEEQARARLEAARLAHARGNAVRAAKEWLLALKCDPAAARREDAALRDAALATLRQAVLRKPDQVELRWSLGYACVHCGLAAEAVKAWDGLAPLEKDPYAIWRTQVWLAAARERLGRTAVPANR